MADTTLTVRSSDEDAVDCFGNDAEAARPGWDRVPIFVINAPMLPESEGQFIHNICCHAIKIPSDLVAYNVDVESIREDLRVSDRVFGLYAF